MVWCVNGRVMEPIFEMSGDAVWSPNILKLGGYLLESQYLKRVGVGVPRARFFKKVFEFLDLRSLAGF